MKLRLSLITAVAALGFASPGHAAFINGGFETGDFTGWTLEHGMNSGTSNILFTPGSAGHAYIVGTGDSDPYSPFDAPFEGNYMVRLNEDNPNYDATRISQTATMLAGESDVFINWGAVVEDPGHAINEQPRFEIAILRNGQFFAGESHNASQGTAGGWQAGPFGPNFSQTYYSSGIFHVGGLVAGDVVTVLMTAIDCSQGGHSGWAYLDGISTVQPPTGGGTVPDAGSTAMMLVPVISAMAAFRARSKQTA
ncbi:MAG TPA: hypothetical protein VIS99_12365 [Terrimicrobiaceae bacterium]